jgi:hypothetical protein
MKRNGSAFNGRITGHAPTTAANIRQRARQRDRHDDHVLAAMRARQSRRRIFSAFSDMRPASCQARFNV